ncbi:MAG TPA: hypothetical protein VEF04_22805, partial [Blastocatellia bacterium]|nr:hypothetical protein [Blastocatellia bacterium]
SVYALQLFSDGTATNFSAFHPVSVSLHNTDRSARILNLKSTQVLAGLAPTERDLSYMYNGERVSFQKARELVKDFSTSMILRHLLREVVKVVMAEVAELEQGFVCDVSGAGVAKVRCFLFSWVCDMEERRNLLNLSLPPHWQCTHCFGRPTPGCQPCPLDDCWELVTDKCARSFETMETLSAINKDDENFGDEAWSFEACFGFKLSERAPFDKELNCIVDGPWSYFLFDRLHMLDGILQKLYKALRATYGQSLDSASMSLGNLACGVSTGVHFHRMEEGLHDFQFVVVALVCCHSALRQRSLDAERIKSHVALVTNFLRIVVILKDDAPGLLQTDLVASIDAFAKALYQLKAELDGTKNEFDITSKMHELIAHCADQVEENGPPSNFTSDAFEWDHKRYKSMQSFGSMRNEDKRETVLRQSCYDTLLAEVPAASTKGEIRPSTSFEPLTRFRVLKRQSAVLCAQEQMLANLDALFVAFTVDAKLRRSIVDHAMDLFELEGLSHMGCLETRSPVISYAQSETAA